MDLAYVLIQVLHNLGAVAVVGGPAAALGASVLARRSAIASPG